MTPEPTLALFTGDSITDMGRRTDPSGHLGAGYVRRLAHMAAIDAPWLTVVNTGIGGDRTVDLLARWENDVDRHHPDVLTVLVGVNDMWRRYDAGILTDEKQFRAAYSALLERARSRPGLRRLVVMEPFAVPITDDQRRWHSEDLNAKIRITRELAVDFDAIHVPLNDIFTERAAVDGVAAVIDDGVHPSAGGHELISQIWWESVLPTLN